MHLHGEELISLNADGEGTTGICLKGKNGTVFAQITVEERNGGTEAWLLSGVLREWLTRREVTFRASESCHLSIAKQGSFLTLSSDTVIGRAIREKGVWADHDLNIMRSHINPGATVLDVGANIGHHLVAFSRMVGRKGRVVGFEPQRLIFQMACGNVALNDCRNTTVLQCGLGAESGVAHMNPVNYDDEFNFGSLGIGQDTAGEPVPIRTLDEVCHSEGLGRVDFMKIDVQSYELFVLLGGSNTIIRDRPKIFLEVSPEQMAIAGYDYTKIYDFLRERGYVFDHMDGTEPTIEARVTSGRPGEEWDVLAFTPEARDS